MKISRGGCYCLLALLGSVSVVVALVAGGIVIGSRVGKIDIRTISLAVAVTCSALALILMAFWRLKRR